MSDDVIRSADPVYLDYNASAPLRPEALAAMLPHFASVGNASSAHDFGRVASDAVEQARSQLAQLLNCRPDELILTSGATEANNLALHLAAYRGGVVTTAVEHPAVLEAARALADLHGTRLVIAGVDGSGLPRLEEIASGLAVGDIGVVSVMLANNETGVATELGPIVEMAHDAGALVHTDATQAVGRLPIDLAELDVDLLSLSAHKFGGPQGIGALFIRRSAHLPQRPLLFGGGHERGWRAGTTNVAGAAGMGAAAAVCAERMTQEVKEVAGLRDRLERELLSRLAGSWANGAGARRLPGTLSLTIPGIPADALMTAMPMIAVSNGSACHAGVPSPSHVLLALGLSPEDAECTVRFSLGYQTTADEVTRAIGETCTAVKTLRSLLAPAPRSAPPLETGKVFRS
jgi:cysteine desulfurase